jgi:hypothetical protein
MKTLIASIFALSLLGTTGASALGLGIHIGGIGIGAHIGGHHRHCTSWSYHRHYCRHWGW